MSTLATPARPRGFAESAPRRRGPLYSQLPVHSPLTLAAVAAGVEAVLRRTRDPRAELERLLRERFEADAAVLCGSGTDALQLALRAAMAERGSDRVALPAFSCYDVASAAIAAGASLCFYDVEPRTLGPVAESMRLAAEAAGVVVVSPLYGIPVDWSAVQEVRAATGALIVEDAAQAAGSRWRGRLVGSLGELSVLSFGRGKGWTGGGGGALLVRGPPGPGGLSPERPISTAGEARVLLGALAQLVLGRPGLYRIPLSVPSLQLGETVWHDAAAPRPISRVSAAVALATGSESDRENGRRAAIGASLLHELAGIDSVEAVHPTADAEATYLRFPILVSGGFRSLPDPTGARRLGIAGSYPLPLPQLPQVAAARVDRASRYPGAERLARDLVTLPTHRWVSAADRVHLLQALHR